MIRAAKRFDFSSELTTGNFLFGSEIKIGRAGERERERERKIEAQNFSMKRRKGEAPEITKETVNK